MPRKSQPEILCEILPIVLQQGHFVCLRQEWYIPLKGEKHPNDLVLECIRQSFADDVSIVHSTSWRYDTHNGQSRVILTYLAVIPNDVTEADHQVLETVEVVQGSSLAAPQEIAAKHVLGHALAHLAYLQKYDQAIAQALQVLPGWMEKIASLEPRVAGYLS